MPNANRNGQRKLLNYMNAEGVTEKKLEEILEEELKEPEDQIDMQLVESILSELEPREISEDEIDASWQRLEKKMDALHSGEKRTHPSSVVTGKKRFPVVLRNLGIAAAAVVILFFATIGTAKATRWTFLLKLLQPITETFGIKLGDETKTDSAEHYSTEFDDQEMQLYRAEEEIPLKYKEYPIKLRGVPDRFEFVEGNFYPTQVMNTFNFAYRAGEDWLSYNINVFSSEDVGIEYLFETTLEVRERRNIGMIEVTFYQNDNADTLYVSWINKNAHYSLYGAITYNELNEIINEIQ